MDNKKWYTLLCIDPNAISGIKIHWLLTNIHQNGYGTSLSYYLVHHDILVVIDTYF